jgi:glycosyltransferase involved in cell wall biosynthesis
VRIVIWHGWLLEGSGSNVGTARLAEAWRAAGHDVLLLCQERHPERYGWIDAHGLVDGGGPGPATTLRAPAAGGGRCVLLRPQIGNTLPVFVVDRYEGYEDVRRFPDLEDDELESYLRANVEALRAAVAWHGSEAAVTGHAIPGAAIARRALGAGAYVAKIHGSDLEYAVRLQVRFQDLAREGLGGARAVVGPSAEVLDRCATFVPEVRRLGRVVPPGVDVEAFRARPRWEALRAAAERLETDPDTGRGRPDALDAEVERALAARDAVALDTLATRYDQNVADPGAAGRLRALATSHAPVVGFLGKLIPQKGPALVLAAQRSLDRDTEALIVGFGSHREWLVALDLAYRRDDVDARAWLAREGKMGIDRSVLGSSGGPRRVTFTGRLDHRYAPDALAAMDVLVVPSILEEAFGMVMAEGAAVGALPLVARHSGLAEVAGALESEVGRPGLFSFEPGDGAVPRIAAGIDRLLSIDADERARLAGVVSAFVGSRWTWKRAAADLLDAAT